MLTGKQLVPEGWEIPQNHLHDRFVLSSDRRVSDPASQPEWLRQEGHSTSQGNIASPHINQILVA